MLNDCVDVILSNEFNSLDNINRFNGIRVMKHENVAQHSYWVTIFATLLVDEFVTAGALSGFIEKPSEVSTFQLKVLNACLFHDFDESLTGDILFDFKYNKVNGSSVKELLKEFVNDALTGFDEGTAIERRIFTSINDCDGGIMTKIFVKMADWLACIKYEYNEIQMGNALFIPIIKKSERSLNELLDNFLNVFANEKDTLKNSMTEAVNKYKNISNKLNC
jgi:5'-deoxynucleotidase YfbR-like HD superfamily hydrolase